MLPYIKIVIVKDTVDPWSSDSSVLFKLWHFITSTTSSLRRLDLRVIDGLAVVYWFYHTTCLSVVSDIRCLSHLDWLGLLAISSSDPKIVRSLCQL